MRRYRIDNLYESALPPENTDNLWADVDENTKELRAIHKYNKSKGEWEPNMVSVEYIKSEGNEPTVTIIPCDTELRVTNITDSILDYQLVQVVVPNSPFYGEVEGSQTRSSILAEELIPAEIDSENMQNIKELPLMDIIVGFYNNRNGFPFDPEHYRRCKLRIVASEDELETDSNTVVFNGGLPSVKFIKYIVKLDN